MRFRTRKSVANLFQQIDSSASDVLRTDVARSRNADSTSRSRAGLAAPRAARWPIAPTTPLRIAKWSGWNVNLRYWPPLNVIIDNHKCTQVENPGGYLKFLPKSVGGSRLSGKITRGVHLFGVLLHFYYQVFRKFAWGVLFHTPLTPLCASM
jgi:hypothetical protein